jgi:hypothetical protein
MPRLAATVDEIFDFVCGGRQRLLEIDKVSSWRTPRVTENHGVGLAVGTSALSLRPQTLGLLLDFVVETGIGASGASYCTIRAIPTEL